MRLHHGACLLAIVALAACASRADVRAESARVLHDGARDRSVPIVLYAPREADRCDVASPCPVALLSPGYGLAHSDYTFVAQALNRFGYLVVAVGHQLPGDPPLPRGGDPVAQRAPSWTQGAQTLRFVRDTLAPEQPAFDWDHVVLVGHSHGGDLSAWLLRDPAPWVAALVTLDHRRVPLPRRSGPRVLTIRAGDFPADPGVLPSPDERRSAGTCVVDLPYARHDDIHDGGGERLKRDIAGFLVEFIEDGTCPDSTPDRS